jgi:hypothetical protein
MLSDSTLAEVAQCDHDDAPVLLKKIGQRVGPDTLRRAYLVALQPAGADGEADNNAPRFLQAGEFLKMVGDPPAMLVDQLLPEKSTVLLSGKPKAGKSLMALDLLDDLCQGRPIFGQFRVNRAGPVCYLGMEDGRYEIANRLLKRGLRSTDTARPLYVCASRLRLPDPDSLALLAEVVAQIQPVLIVVDTAREALGIRDWNDPAEVSDAIRPVRDFARQHCTVLIVAHNRKAAGEDSGDEIAGSNAFSSSVDGWISAPRFERLANGNRRLYLSINGRGGMNGEAVVEMDTHDLHFAVVPDETLSAEREQKRQDQDARRFDTVLDALRALGGQGTIAQVAKHLDKGNEAARRLLADAVAAGLLPEPRQESATGGRPALVYHVRNGRE